MSWKTRKKGKSRQRGLKFKDKPIFVTYRGQPITLNLEDPSLATENSQQLLEAFRNTKTRDRQLKLKRAMVSAANKAKGAGQGEVAEVYRKAYQQMILGGLPPFPKNSTVLGYYKDERGVQPIMEPKKGTKRRSYQTPHQSCPELHPAKLAQRKALADKMTSKGTVLELYAGKGGLTKEVYAKKANKVVMVDKNAKLLKKADKLLKGKVKREIILADNKAWLKNEMGQEQLNGLKLVDFDAFGSPAVQVKTFFDNYEVKKPLLVALTDGSAIYLGYCQNAKGRRWLKQHYGIDVLPAHFGTREQQVQILNKFMEAQGRKHGFKVEPISVAHGDVKTIYAGYKITPKR